MKNAERIYRAYLEHKIDLGQTVVRWCMYAKPEEVRALLPPPGCPITDEFEAAFSRWDAGQVLQYDGKPARRGYCTSCSQPVIVREEIVDFHDWPPNCRSVCPGSKKPPKE